MQFFDENGQEVENTEFAEDGGIDIGEAGAAAEQFVANLTKESAEVANMSEAERRFDVASYYRQLVRVKLFESDDEGARQVEAEIQSFAEGRLQSLLGIRTDNQPMAVAKPQFTDEEAAALRKFASMSEAEQKVLWALLATAARSKSVVGPPAPAKVQQVPAKVAPVQGALKPAPTVRKIAAPARALAPTPAPETLAKQPRPRQPAPRPAPGAPPAPLPMPRGKGMESVMMHTAITQAQSGERIDESFRRGGNPEGPKVMR